MQQDTAGSCRLQQDTAGNCRLQQDTAVETWRSIQESCRIRIQEGCRIIQEGLAKRPGPAQVTCEGDRGYDSSSYIYCMYTSIYSWKIIYDSCCEKITLFGVQNRSSLILGLQCVSCQYLFKQTFSGCPIGVNFRFCRKLEARLQYMSALSVGRILVRDSYSERNNVFSLIGSGGSSGSSRSNGSCFYRYPFLK